MMSLLGISFAIVTFLWRHFGLLQRLWVEAGSGVNIPIVLCNLLWLRKKVK